jgi:hypothetical protein
MDQQQNPERVYQVFLSSTFSDLEEERREISNTLAKAGFLVAGMELFPASDEEQMSYIKRIIDRSDYYVVIIGGRYGSLASDGQGYTEKEYEYAVSKRIPVLAFLHASPRSLPRSKTEEDQHKEALLNGFIARLKGNRLVQFWRSTKHSIYRQTINGQ